ncbi:MAG: YicC/YloC family endoribonuclease [Pikeienuella sp.]
MQSMTGFASVSAEAAGRRWRWEAKSVNGRGLDVRFRMYDGLTSDETGFRTAVQKAFKRGSVAIHLREDGGGEAGVATLNAEALAAVIDAARKAEDMADAAGLSLRPASAADLIAVKGVLDNNQVAEQDDKALAKGLTDSFGALMTGLAAAREAEGARIHETLTGQIDQIEALSIRAGELFDSNQDGAGVRLRAKLAEITEAGAEVDEERLTQELAIIAVKGDVREELDRLKAHIEGARELLAAKGPVGRKLDFLTQEFNREANTLCSKSNSTALTQCGLDLKVVIDQLREQAQNVE